MLDWTVGYDRAGNKTHRKSNHDPRDSQRYAYDSANRLTAMTRGVPPAGGLNPGEPGYCAPSTSTAALPDLARARQWNLDGVGNWSQTTECPDPQSASTTTIRLDTPFNEYYDIAGVTQMRDDNGNLLECAARAYTWEAFNRLAG